MFARSVNIQGDWKGLAGVGMGEKSAYCNYKMIIFPLGIYGKYLIIIIITISNFISSTSVITK